MPQGLEIKNSAGALVVPSTGLKNLVLMGKGIHTIGSNTSATGARGTLNTGLPTLSDNRYLIFIRTAGNALILKHDASFEWFMAQGTTSFTWYAFSYGNQTALGLNAGIQVYDTDGSLIYEIGRPALRLRLIDTSGAAAGEIANYQSTANILESSPPSTFTIAANEAVMYSDAGFTSNGMYPFFYQTVMAYLRYMPTICTDNMTLRMRWGRIYPNKSLGGINGGGSFVDQHIEWPTRPTFALCAAIPAGI